MTFSLAFVHSPARNSVHISVHLQVDRNMDRDMDRVSGGSCTRGDTRGTGRQGRHGRHGATGGDTRHPGRHGATRGIRGDTGRHGRALPGRTRPTVPAPSNTMSNTMSSGMSTYRLTSRLTLCSTFRSTVGGFPLRVVHSAPLARPWRPRNSPRDPRDPPARQGGRRNGDPGPAPNCAADPGLRAAGDLTQNPAQNLLFVPHFPTLVL